MSDVPADDHSGSVRSVESQLRHSDDAASSSTPHIGRFSWEQQNNMAEYHNSLEDVRPPELLVQQAPGHMEGPDGSAEASENGMYTAKTGQCRRILTPPMT